MAVGKYGWYKVVILDSQDFWYGLCVKHIYDLDFIKFV